MTYEVKQRHQQQLLYSWQRVDTLVVLLLSQEFLSVITPVNEAAEGLKAWEAQHCFMLGAQRVT